MNNWIYIEIETIIKDLICFTILDYKCVVKYIFGKKLSGQDFGRLLGSYLLTAKYENIQPLNRNRPRSF